MSRRINVAGGIGNVTEKRNHGFGIYMMPPKNQNVKFRDVIIIAFVGYIIEIIAIIMFVLRNQILSLMTYIYGSGIAIGDLYAIPVEWVFWYLFLSLVIGGLPVLGEVLPPIYYVLAWHPHMVWMVLLNFIALSIFADLYGSYVGSVMFILFISTGFYINNYYQKQLKELGEPLVDQSLAEVVDLNSVGLM